MKFYIVVNINTWNGHETNKLVSFYVVVVNTYKRCHSTLKLTKLMLFKRDEL